MFSASAAASEEEDDTGGLLVGEVVFVFVFVLSICKASALCWVCWGLVTIFLVTGFVSMLSICEASALCCRLGIVGFCDRGARGARGGAKRLFCLCRELTSQ